MIRKAFLLGAGLGTRLRPLTDQLPKPLVPLFHRPLVEWAMKSCAEVGIEDFAINTHHLPDKWLSSEGGWLLGGDEDPGLVGGNGLAARKAVWEGRELRLFQEPVLLETGGGIRNIEAWVGDDDVLVHNGDIFSTMPLASLIDAHEKSDNVVTLALRSEGVAKHIAIEKGKIFDIRSLLGKSDGTHVFSGIYCFSPALLELIPPGEKISVIPAFLELAKQGKLGGVVLDDGEWFDLGDRTSYLEAHRRLDLAPAIHPEADIAPGATIEKSVIGPKAVIGTGAEVRDSVVWPGASVAEGQKIDSEVIW